MTDPVHLVIGPTRHGVVRHGTDIATAADQRLLRAATIGHALARLPAVMSGRSADIVHLSFTDNLLGTGCAAAANAVDELADELDRLGWALSVTLHDVPVGDDPRARRRRAAYARVVARARGVVVNSLVELDAMHDLIRQTHSVRCIPLPLDRAAPRPHPRNCPPEAVVLGFVWAGRGHDEVLASLPSGCGLLALGAAADGHHEVVAGLAEAAVRRGAAFRQTGYVSDTVLADRLASAAVPVAPNRQATASASINTWLAHGRRPLVPRTPYTAELAARMPGALWLYDGTDDLGVAIETALREPALTRLSDEVVLGPPLPDVAARYLRHLAACRPPRAVHVSGTTVVPGNRWDLIPRTPDRPPSAAVVIPYYGVDESAQRDLDRVLTGLTLQTMGDRLEIVIADDGSPLPLDVSAAGDVPITVVRQAHDGFGAGRARNLGAAATDHDLIAFLDADTVPEPGYVEQLLQLPARDHRALVVGRRRHADLAAFDRPATLRWLRGTGRAPVEHPEPTWLRDAYRESSNLLQADARSYRHVISAVLGIHRRLFDRLGGFDERFTSYGGEDWELAHRAWQAGALFAHEPSAVAWHHGVDWAGRHLDHRRVKDVETATLAAILPDPAARGAGHWLPYPQLVVTMPAADLPAVLATARTAFSGAVDCGIWLLGPRATIVAHALADPRVRPGPPSADVLARCTAQLDLAGPADLRHLDRLVDEVAYGGIVRSGTAVARATRALGRTTDLPADERDAAIELLFGTRDSTAIAPLPDVPLDDLLAELTHPGRSHS